MHPSDIPQKAGILPDRGNTDDDREKTCRRLHSARSRSISESDPGARRFLSDSRQVLINGENKSAPV